MSLLPCLSHRTATAASDCLALILYTGLSQSPTIRGHSRDRMLALGWWPWTDPNRGRIGQQRGTQTVETSEPDSNPGLSFQQLLHELDSYLNSLCFSLPIKSTYSLTVQLERVEVYSTLSIPRYTARLSWCWLTPHTLCCFACLLPRSSDQHLFPVPLAGDTGGTSFGFQHLNFLYTSRL